VGGGRPEYGCWETSKEMIRARTARRWRRRRATGRCGSRTLLYSIRDARQQISACECGSSNRDFRQQRDAYVAGAARLG
jgi:hypothetical protein